MSDSISNAPIEAGNINVVVRDGAYADSLTVAGGNSLIVLAHERPGTYTVDVSADGYAPWNRSGIKVTKGKCHVQTVDVLARLKR